tara:strand:- start:2317 stop:2601 length:285 start_codon:yes stop_codon:yes gene_type:complete
VVVLMSNWENVLKADISQDEFKEMTSNLVRSRNELSEKIDNITTDLLPIFMRLASSNLFIDDEKEIALKSIKELKEIVKEYSYDVDKDPFSWLD